VKKTILLTRPRAASERWAALLTQHGFASALEPLLTIELTRARRPAGSFQAVLITSANAPEALEEVKESLSDLLALPCFCVGTATGLAARALGFSDVRCSATDSAALAHLVTENLSDTSQSLLHIAGDVVDTKLRDILAKKGFTLTPWIVYHARAAQDFTKATREGIIEGKFDAVVLFSPRSARILVTLIEKNGLTSACTKILAVGLSQAVTDVLQTLPWRHLLVAAAPEENAVLACLQSEFSMTKTEIPPAPVLPKAQKECRPKKFCFLLRALAVLLLAIAGALMLVRCPWFAPMQASPNVAALEKRIAVLETRVTALTEIPPAVPSAGGTNETSDASLSESVKNLQAQVAAMDSKGSVSQQATHNLIAAAFAFLDVRDAAQQGQPFGPALAALRAASGDDATLNAQIEKLAPYAETPAPTFGQLREMLAKEELSLTEDKAADINASLSDRVKNILRPLISFHPLHDPQVVALEQALDNKDAEKASQAYKLLPDESQKKLSPWHAKLEARAELDRELRVLTVYFTTPTVQGSAP